MKTSILVAFFALFYSLSYTQSLTESLGGIPVQFEITSNGKTLSKNQLLIQRDESHGNISTVTNESYAAYTNTTSWHLEFSTPEEFAARKRNRENERRLFNHYLLELYDEDGAFIAKAYINQKRVRIWQSPTTKYKYTYSIDIRGLPLVHLNQTAQIQIEELW